MFTFLCLGNLDLISPKHLLRVEKNPWIQEIQDQIVLGASHVLTYLRSEAYRRLGFNVGCNTFMSCVHFILSR